MGKNLTVKILEEETKTKENKGKIIWKWIGLLWVEQWGIWANAWLVWAIYHGHALYLISYSFNFITCIFLFLFSLLCSIIFNFFICGPISIYHLINFLYNTCHHPLWCCTTCLHKIGIQNYINYIIHILLLLLPLFMYMYVHLWIQDKCGI